MTNLTLKRPSLALALLGTSLVLGACGPKTNPGPNPNQGTTVNTISGTLSPVKAGTIASQRLNKSATVNATGNFDLGLPNVQAMTNQYKGDLTDGSNLFVGCTGGTVNAPAGLKFTNITGLFVNDQNPEYINYSTYTDGVLKYKGWWFVNMDATITADTTCLLGKVKTNMSLKKGWNIVDYTDTYANNTVTSQLSLGTQTNARMSFRPNPISNTTQSLTPQSNTVQINPWGVVR